MRNLGYLALILIFFLLSGQAIIDRSNLNPDQALWSITSTPGANLQATASRPAVAGTKHTATNITVCSQEAALAAGIFVNLRDGASGAGTILWTGFAQNQANLASCIFLRVAISGSVNTAMTLEFSAAGGVGNQQTVTLMGYDQ